MYIEISKEVRRHYVKGTSTKKINELRQKIHNCLE